MTKEEILFAVQAGADLRDADLSDADLSDAYIRDADLSDAYIRGANLRGADLSDADLRGAKLSGADLRGADLRDADLRGAKLSGADLRGADLRDADLRGAKLSGADLRGADLRDADLSGAYIRDADLRGADLRDADLSDADLRGADLRGADLSGTCLDPSAPVPYPTRDECQVAGFEIKTNSRDGDSVWGWRTKQSVCAGKTIYTAGWHMAPVFSVDRDTACHPGIYLGPSLDWMEHYPGIPLVRCWAWRHEMVHAGDKFRAKRIYVVPDGEEGMGGA